jgi:23S rRNA C2498 (ribose-2'-O)-methylase RlmM
MLNSWITEGWCVETIASSAKRFYLEDNLFFHNFEEQKIYTNSQICEKRLLDS